MSRHISWLNSATRLAKQSSHWPYKMSCIVVKGGKVISKGINKPDLAEAKDARYNMGRGIHAELSAILNAARNGVPLKGAVAYVAGLTKAGNLTCSKPCELCYKLLPESGIKAVYYFDQDKNIQCINFNQEI